MSKDKEIIGIVNYQEDVFTFYDNGTYRCVNWDDAHPSYLWKIEDDKLWYASIEKDTTQSRWCLFSKNRQSKEIQQFVCGVIADKELLSE